MSSAFNLSSAIRENMVKEIISAQASGNIYLSKKFNSEGNSLALELLVDAATAYDEHWLAYEIENRALMKSFEPRTSPLGEYSLEHVADPASESYADAQFNRFYMIAVCQLASLQGKTVTVYRANEKGALKQSSEKMIGKIFNAEALKTELRSMKLSLAHELLAANAGLSVKATEAHI